MFVTLCPKGSEGAYYAMFTTAWNSAMILARSISSMLLPIWDVSVTTLSAGKVQGLFKLSLLTAIVQAIPLFFLGWLPHSRDELLRLATGDHSQSSLGGILFLGTLVASMTYTIMVGILNIFAPDWDGGS